MGGAEHPGILYFYSESIGFAANGTCAFIAALSNLGVVEERNVSTGILFLVVGGIIQLLCSLRAFRSYDHFGGTVLGFYSAFWALLGVEIISSSNINLLHIPLVVVGFFFMIVAPLINCFYTVLVSSITFASSMELVLRVVSDESPAAVQVVAAISELIVVLTTSYGVVAAILHGIQERQVLPGFDNALVETVLWKRGALKSKYSYGTWANPAPLGSICSAMGFAGMATLSHVLWSGSGNNWALTLWFSTWAALLGLVTLLHTLRHEQVWAVSSICDTCLFALAATMDINEVGNANGGIFVTFAFVRLFLSGFGIAEELTLVHTITFILRAISLFAVDFESFILGGGGTIYQAAMASTLLFSLTSVLDIYAGVADLANSVAQKLLFPTGQDISLRSYLCTANKVNDELSMSTADNNMTDVEEGEWLKTSKFDTKMRAIRNLLSEYENKEKNAEGGNDDDIEHKYPGDHQILGQSDFQSPLFIMITGIALYSTVMSIALFTDSGQALFDSSVLLLVTQTLALLIATCRGQTCFGFLSFTFLLEGIILLVGYFSGDKSYLNLIIPAVLQFAWLLASFSVFRFLTVSTVIHLTGLFFYMLGEGNGIAALAYISGVFFILCSIVSVVTLGLLLGSSRSTLCRWMLQHTAADTEKLCEVGFASDREKFDECVRILKEGGVACIPTDTVYCLACAADRPEAIKRIYDIKSRPSEKPLSLWLGSIDDIKSVAPEGKGWSPKTFAFMESIWPGSVSLVVSRGSWLQRMGVGSSADLIGTHDSIALRVPNSTLTVALLKETGPLAITSANPSGACDCTHHNKVDDVIASKIDYILADGASPMTIASSVVDVRNVDKNELFFYRVGCVPEAYIWSKLNGTIEDEPIVLQNIHSIKAINIQNFMSQLITLVPCDTYKVYFLVSAEDNGVYVEKKPWEDFAVEYPRIKSAWLSGVSFYDGGLESEDVNSSQMVVPIRNSHGKVIAILQLLDKSSRTSGTGSLAAVNKQGFQKEDLPFANMASTVLRENVASENNVSAPEGSHWTDAASVVILDEHTQFGRMTRHVSAMNRSTSVTFGRRQRPSFSKKLLSHSLRALKI